jgi:hypothetical protein
MSQYPTPGGGPNQTLLELILALKGLAQTFDLAHANLRSLIESESRANARELDRIRDLIAKNSQSLSVLPITISDRVERLTGNLEGDIEEKIDSAVKEITGSINQVQEKFVHYIQAKGESVPEELLEPTREVTGRIELHKDGSLDVRMQTEWVKRLIVAAKWGAIGGGGYGVIEFLKAVFSKMADQ